MRKRYFSFHNIEVSAIAYQNALSHYEAIILSQDMPKNVILIADQENILLTIFITRPLEIEKKIFSFLNIEVSPISYRNALNHYQVIIPSQDMLKNAILTADQEQDSPDYIHP